MIWAGGKPSEESTRKSVKRKDNSRHRAQAFRDLNGDLQSCSYTSLGRFKSFEEGLMPMPSSELLIREGDVGENSDVRYSRQASRGNPG